MANRFTQTIAISICFYISVILAFMTYYDNEAIFNAPANYNLKSFYWGTFFCFNITVVAAVLIPYIFKEPNN